MKTWQIIKGRWGENSQVWEGLTEIPLDMARNEILDLIDEIERLQADNARLQAELDELRQRLDALGKIDWGRVGEGK